MSLGTLPMCRRVQYASFPTMSLIPFSWKLLGIEELGMNSFNELSGGQQQKVLIARALVQEAEVMLLDEPTSNLDIWHQLDVMNVIKSLVKKKVVTALMAIHDMSIASKYIIAFTKRI